MLQEIDFKNLREEINKVAKIGVFYVDLATEESFWDPILKDIFELAPDFIPYKGASDQFFTNPKELENKYATYRKSFSEGTPFEMVNHILTAKGNRKYIRTFGWPVMRDGHCIALSGKVMDITAQKETERDLIQIKEQWDLAEELVDIGYWQWNVQEDHFQCSDNLRAIYGIGVGTKINLDLILEKVCDDDKELFVSNIEKSIRNKQFETFTYTICTTEKEIRFLRANGKVITDESGQVTEMVGTTQDISEDITRQKELEQKNEQLSVAEELAKVGYVHWNIIHDESYWSDNTYRIYGIQIGEHLTFEKFMSIVHPDDIQPLQQHVEKIIETGNFERIVHRTIPINGTIKTVEILGKAVKGENGETIELKSSIHDITERVARENDLVEKTQLMDFGEQLANIAYWQWDVVRDHITCSDNLYHIHGYPYGTFLNKAAILKSMLPEDRDVVGERLTSYLASGNFEKFTHRVLHPNNKITTVQVMGKAFKDKAGKVVKILGVTRDITERAFKEQEILRRTKLMEIGEQIGNLGFWQWYPEKDALKFSNNVYRILGLEVGIPMSFEKMVTITHPEDIPLIHKKGEQFLNEKGFNQFTYRIIQPDGTIRTMEVCGNKGTNGNSNELEILGTIQDITERREAEIQLINRNEQLKIAERLAKIGYWEWNIEKNTVQWSENLYKINGFDPKNPISFELWLTKIHPDDLEMLQSTIQRMLDTKEFISFTHRMVINDDKTIVVEHSGTVIIDSSNTVVRMLGTTQDITDKVASKHLLEEKNRNLLNAEKIAKIGHWNLDLNTHEAYGSENYYEIMGLQKGQPLNFESTMALIHKDDLERTKKTMEKVFTDKVLEDSFFRVQLSNGDIRHIHGRGEILFDDNGNPKEIRGTSQDITEQRKKEQLLIEKNQQLLYAEKMAKIGNWRWNALTNEVIWSNNLYEIYGHDKNEPVTFDKYLGYIHHEDRHYVTTKIGRAVESGVYEELIYRIQLNDGTIKTIKSIGSVTLDETGQTIEMLGTCQDVTDQILREKELTEKNMQLSFAEEMAGIGYWNWNLEEGTVNWSDNLYRIFGFELGIPLKFEDVFAPIHPDDKAHVQKATEEIISSRIFAPMHYRIVLQDGSIRNIELFGKVMTDTKNQVIEVMGTAQDITESTKIQEALVQKNHQLSTAEKMAQIGHWTLDPITKKASWSDNLYEIYGIKKGTPISNENFIDFIHEDDREMAKAKILKIIGTKKFEDLVYRIRLEKGLVKTIKMVGKVITDPKGNIVELLGTCQDISEQIAKEQELLEKNQMMAFAEELSGIGYWKWDIMNDVMDKSDNLMRILDFELGTPMNFKRYLSRVHPKDQDSVIEQSQLIEKTKKFEKFTHRIIRLDGSIRTLEITGEVVLDEKGSVTELIGSSNDITDRINDEQELLQQNQLLNLAEELSGIGHWKWSILKSKFEISENFYRILDIDLNESMDYGKFMNSLPLEDREFVTNKLHEILQTKKFEKFSHRIIKKDGSIRSLEVVGDVITDKNGAVELIGTAQDVTERRMAEKKFRGLLESAPDAIIILNKRGKITIANKQAENLLGYAIEELLNKHISFVTPPKFKNLHREYAAKFFNDPNQGYVVKNQELFIKNKAGGQIPVQVSIGPVETADGLLISIAIRDITLRKKAEKRLLQTNRRLKETAKKLSIQNQQLSDFNHITSHNLRSPVSNLNALLKLLQAENDEIRRALLFEKFEKVIDHLSSTLDTLVETLRIKSETAQNQTKISFEKVLTKTKDILTAQIMDSGAEIISNFSKASKIEYNEVYLESIFLNLVSNAIKYKSPLRPPVIHIESWVEDGKTKLKIADNGLGIDLKKNGKKLFGLNKVFHRHPEAKGVGLFLTKAQVEAMGGTITAESEVNVGTTFLITLD